MAALTFLHHPPFSRQSDSREITVLRGFGAPGEVLSLAFALRAEQAVSDVEIVAADLHGSTGRIASDNIDLHIVHVWPQAGIGVYQSAAQEVPELLLKDDRQPLRDGYRRRYAHWRHLLQPAYSYVPPDVRLHGSAATALSGSRHKQIWVSIKIPAGCTPGAYRGWVEARSPAGAFAAQRLALELEVLPIVLRDPEQDLFIWYKGSLNPRLPRHCVPPPIFRAQLQDIFDHGFRSISLTEYSREHLQRALDIASAVGFRRTVVLPASAARLLDMLDFHGMRPIFYISDEIDARGPAAVDRHLANWRMVKQAGGETMISLTQQSFIQRLLDVADLGCPPDVVSYYLPRNLDYFRARSVFRQLRDRPTYYYWMSHMEKPNVHRVLAGLYLWRSGASGISPYCYQHLPRHPFSPFDDFDEWDSSERIGDDLPPLKDHMSTYPARNGVIPTVQWKGLSAGLYDLRYVSALDAALAHARCVGTPQALQLARAAGARLQRIAERIPLGAITITSETNPEPYASLDAEEYHRMRHAIARDIVLLQAL